MSEGAEGGGENHVAQEGTTVVQNDWRENLPEEVRGWDEAKNADNPDKFWQQMSAHRRMLGQSIRIPTDEASAEDMEAFYGKVQNKVNGLMRVPDPENTEQIRDTFKKLGLPDSADGYGNLDAEGFDPNDPNYNVLKGMAHDAGLTKAQFKALAKKMHEGNYEQSLQAQQKQSNDFNVLKGEWGHALDHRLEVAANMAEKTGAPPQLVESVKAGKVDSTTAKWLYGLSQQLGGEIASFTNSAIAQPTPAELQADIDEIMGNAKGAYWDNQHPAHKRTVDKVLELRKKMLA